MNIAANLPRPWVLALVAATLVLVIAVSASADELPDLASFNKKPLTGAKLVWLQGLVEQARANIRDGDSPESVAYGQAAVETGWGSAGRNNPWGKRGSGDAGSALITTHEVIGLQEVEQKNQQFAVFSSPAAAAKGYVDFLNGKSYQPAHHLRSSDPGAWLLWLWAMGYATATHYPAAVVDASRKIAVSLNDARLAVPWTARHADIASRLAQVAAGKPRRTLAASLLDLQLA